MDINCGVDIFIADISVGGGVKILIIRRSDDINCECPLMQRTTVTEALAGAYATLDIEYISNGSNASRRLRERHAQGIVLADHHHIPAPLREFKADVWVLHHSTTITVRLRS